MIIFSERKLIKQSLFISALFISCLLFTTTSYSQENIGGGLSVYTPGFNFGLDARTNFKIKDNMEITPSINYYFGSGSTFILNGDFHYLFGEKKKLIFYPLAGFSFIKYTGGSHIQLNLGGGIRKPINSSLSFYSEGKLAVSSNTGFLITAGILYNIKGNNQSKSSANNSPQNISEKQNSETDSENKSKSKNKEKNASTESEDNINYNQIIVGGGLNAHLSNASEGDFMLGFDVRAGYQFLKRMEAVVCYNGLSSSTEEEKIKLSEIEFSAHYLLGEQNSFRFYPLAGFSILSQSYSINMIESYMSSGGYQLNRLSGNWAEASTTKTWFNVGIGMKTGGKRINFFSEAKYMHILADVPEGDAPFGLSITAGILYNLKF